MNIDELIAQAVSESHPHDLLIIRRYIAWVKLRRKIHNTFYARVHWVSSNAKPCSKIEPIAVPFLQERRREYRVKFNAHWING